MAGTFPGVSGVQQLDRAGKPNVGAQLSVFVGGTNTLALTYQDVGLAILAENPLVADDTGRIPLFFVADGTYKVRLVDRFGDITNGGFEYPQVPSIGASSSGGGGSAVDPTTIAATGDVKPRLTQGTLAGWVRCNGRTLGNAVSGASERAANDAEALFLYLWTNFTDAQCPVLGGRGISALDDWNAGKQITLIDLRGRAIFGLDDMGNAAAGRLNGATFEVGTAVTPYARGGAAANTLTQAQLPNVNLNVTIPAGQGAHVHPTSKSTGVTSTGGDTTTGFCATANTFSDTNSATLPQLTGTAPLGSGQSHSTISPFALGTVYMKL